MSRPSPFVIILVVVAAGLLALSFVPWGRPPATNSSRGGFQTRPYPTRELTAAERGRTLFTLKGCATCHRHDGLGTERLTQDGDVVPVSQSLVNASGAPDLTHYQPDPDFVRTWLKDPQALRPGTRMPNLRLKEEEIEALLAFLQTNTAEE